MIKPPSAFPPPTRRTSLDELMEPAPRSTIKDPVVANPLGETAAAPVASERSAPTTVDQAKARVMARSSGAGVQHQVARSIKEPEEQQILGGKDTVGKMVDLGGNPENGLALTIHGINGAPEDVDALSQHSLDGDVQTRTYAYDDNYRRLKDTASDLSGQLQGWLQENPGKPLTVHAHSMGSRVALAALDDLNKKGLLKGREVEFNMVAPPLGGYASANFAVTAPDFIAGGIKNLRPSKDMGTNSAFQEKLEAARLPDNVKVRIFTAGHDTVVDYDNPHFKTIVGNLRAPVIALPDADHVNSVEAAARWLKAN
jgi:hypothetical protein